MYSIEERVVGKDRGANNKNRQNEQKEGIFRSGNKKEN